MKFLIGLVFMTVTFFAHFVMAQNYSCTNANENLALTIQLLKSNVATVDVTSPFKKKLNCDTYDFEDSDTNGIIKGFDCGLNAGEDEVPDILGLSMSSLQGFIEVVGQSEYTFDCKLSLN